ncbi:MAG: hypothetical protein AB8F95_19285 [Bacteroidia bacterium]
MKNAIQTLSQNPKKLFIIDGLGALLSAFLLGIVLVKLESIFGIPRSALYVLAVIPCFFAAYDLLCYFLVKKQIRRYLHIIAIANILYCILSLGMAWHHSESLTLLGWGYIIIEIVIVLAIANIEIR